MAQKKFTKYHDLHSVKELAKIQKIIDELEPMQDFMRVWDGEAEDVCPDDGTMQVSHDLAIEELSRGVALIDKLTAIVDEMADLRWELLDVKGRLEDGKADQLRAG